MIVEDFNTPLSSTDRLSRQKINKETSKWHYRPKGLNEHLLSISLSSCTIHILLGIPWNSPQNIRYGHKASLSKIKKGEITPCILSDHNGIKLEFNSKRNYIKYSNTWRLKNTFLKEEIPKFLESNENENTTYQNVWNIAKAVVRGKFIT
jgi:hypothetical protein